ncbi:MAG: galactokinase [Anaerolineae bacterium]|nr:galactokinase [Anaerolineae bacterium]NUQ07007.1 galactokinase [Anaerolineae bacterium]
MSLQQRVTDAFTAQFGEPPTLITRAPGRVNLIGEHTDYNDGFVLPMAIDRAVWIALRPRQDGYVFAHSLEFNESAEFLLAEMAHRHGEWAEYIKGVAWSLQENGYELIGWDGIVTSDVPVGASLSSSAAFELASARAFAELSDIPWDPAVMAKICQRAENEWVGVSSGIMDQMISASGVDGEALLIDCRDLSTQRVIVPAGTVVIVMDTMTRRELSNSGYNDRVHECKMAVAALGVKALRDATLPMLDSVRQQIDEVVYRRARHVITEDARTLEAVEAMNAGDAARMGDLMNASHRSLHEDYEVTNHHTNLMAVIAQGLPGCYGARMTGGGFGGCAVALVEAGAAETFSAAVAAEYRAQTNIDPAIYVCRASAGATIVEAS